MKLTSWMVALAGLAAMGLLIYGLGPVLTPFLVSAAFAYLGDPLADALERWRVPRGGAVALVFSFLILLGVLSLLLVVPLLERQLLALVGKLPGFLDWLQATGLPWLSMRTGLDMSMLSVTQLKPALTEHWQSAGSALGFVMSTLSSSGAAIVGWFGNLMLIPVVTFYLLRDWDVLVRQIHALVPRRYAPGVAQIAGECDEVLSAFVRGQLLVMMGLGAVYATGLWFVGLEVALLIGMIAGLASIVPYLGFIVGIIAASIAAFMQFQDWQPLVYVALVFGVGQIIEGFVLTPWLVGDRIGLHPVAVIFAILAGGQLFGFVGILLALPLAAVIKVLLSHGHAHYLRSSAYHEGAV
ncbi:MAG: AI-2E family transporter [Gammaproteobacteria bacterium]|nr:AI-2E family transporter [Gammaproteobacteria bacterium]